MRMLAGRNGARGLFAAGLIIGSGLLAGCNVPHTPDAVVGNQGTKDSGETGSATDSAGRVISNPATGAGDRKGLGN